MRAPTETALVRACLDYLRLRGVLAWRQNTSGLRRQDRRGRTFWAPAALVGISDIIGILPGGRFLALEAKVGKRQPTAEQLLFLEAIATAGGLAGVVRSLKDLEALLGPAVTGG
jgi:hypothetical protein